MSNTITHPLVVGTTIRYYRRESCKQLNRVATGKIRAYFKQQDVYVYRLVGETRMVSQKNVIEAY